MKTIVQISALTMAVLGRSASLPNRFTYLREVDPTIVQSVRYHTS